MKNLRYLIDENDIILKVNREWNEFAKESQTSEIDESIVVGQSLWKFISHTGMHLLYEMILKRARDTKQKITLPFRCDSPSIRRFMQIEITPLNNNEVEFETQLLSSHSRAPIYFPVHKLEENALLLHICSWCNLVKITETEWVEIEDGINRLNLFSQEPLPMITHDMCPSCFEKIMKKVKLLGEK